MARISLIEIGLIPTKNHAKNAAIFSVATRNLVGNFLTLTEQKGCTLFKNCFHPQGGNMEPG